MQLGFNTGISIILDILFCMNYSVICCCHLVLSILFLFPLSVVLILLIYSSSWMFCFSISFFRSLFQIVNWVSKQFSVAFLFCSSAVLGVCSKLSTGSPSNFSQPHGLITHCYSQNA